MRCRFQSACVFAVLTLGLPRHLHAELQPQPPSQPPALHETSATNQQPPPNSQEKLARIWANEPPLLRLARDKFGAELSEIDAKFFAAVTAGEWADFRPSADATYDAEEPSSWAESAVVKAHRITWLCTDGAAKKLVSSRGIWIRGAKIEGKIELYRSEIPFSLTVYDCLLAGGINLAHAKLQELDIRDSCAAGVQARGVQIAENVYLLKSTVSGGLDFIDAQIGGDFDFSGGLALHGTKDDIGKPGVSLNLHDAMVGGDVKLADKFRAFGQVRLIGAQIGRGLSCTGGQFAGAGQMAIDAQRSSVAGIVSFTAGFRADGGIEMRRSRIGGDLDCDGGRFIAAGVEAINADLVNVGGQVLMGDGFHAEGEVRLINAVVAGDVDCDNGHFLHEGGDALSLDTTVIGSSLRIGYDTTAATDDADADLPPGFLARGTLRLWGTQVNQDILASGARFETPAGVAILGCNLRVASRVVLAGVQAQGTVNLFSADIEHELDLRGSQFDARQTPDQIAIWANGIQVRGHVYCNRIDAPDQVYPFRVDGLMSFQFATISMHWDLYGAQLIRRNGDALDASDCRVGGYVNLDTVTIDGRASFSRAKIDGMWILNKVHEPERLWLDLRFAHIWVIKDERLDDWPPAGQLQLEGLVYDHFDDDSPLGVEDRLAWLRRQYAPNGVADVGRTILSVNSTAPTDRIVRPTSTAIDDAVVQTQMQVPSMPPPIVPPAPMMAPPPPEMPAPPTPMPIPNASLADSEKDVRDGMAPPSEVETAQDDQETQTESPTSLPAVADPAGRRYITQPYTQLASVYRAIGQDEQANAVLVARAERLGELSPVFSAQGFWYRYLGRLIGYGYEPFRAIKIGLAIIVVGAVVFAIGAHRGLMAETKLAEHVLSQEGEPRIVSPTYPRFNPFVYSLDVFLPFVDLHQICYWIPGERVTKPRTSRNCLMHLGPYSLKWSAVLRGYLWFQTLAGWTLCTLLAAAVTGIVES
ncbi:MAG: hypothetical protein WD738_11985 [Pirellulales bacterium]